MDLEAKRGNAHELDTEGTHHVIHKIGRSL